jgi:membrane-bound lytic murein transglycosylase B
MRYNNSTSYALAVCHLADRLRGGGPIKAAWPIADRPLSRSERLEFQRQQATHHYLDGAVDGMIGPVTRTAIRRFQKQAGLPADGYPTVKLLDRLRTWPAG